MGLFNGKRKTPLPLKLTAAVLRGTAGAFILNSGLGKRGLSGEPAEGLQNMAATGLPFVKDMMTPDDFVKALSTGEIALGSALLAPFIPNRLAGLGLAAFGGGLLTMYFGNDEMTNDDGITPSQAGLSLAKDSWLLAMGLALITLPKGQPQD